MEKQKEILEEIERLKKSPYVKLGREQMRLKQQLYNLRHLEKIGKEAAKGKGGKYGKNSNS